MSEGNGKWAPRTGHIPGAPLNIGGHDLVLAPLGLRLAREFEDRGKALYAKGKELAVEEAHAYNLDLILASLRRNYEDMTAEALENLLDTPTEADAVKLVLDQSGLKRVKPGELKPGS